MTQDAEEGPPGLQPAPDFWNDAGNPARPKPGVALAHLADLPDGGAIVRDFAEGAARFSLILARRGDAVFAYYNLCPHARYPLERPDGRMVVQEGRFLICAAHGASFTLEGGRCIAGPGLGTALRPFPIALEDGLIRAAG